MALVLAEDSVKETTSTTGIDVLLLSGAVSGFSTFAAGVGANNTTYYTIEDANGNFEIGVGTVRTSPDRLERNIVLASSTGSKLALSSGTHTVESGYASNRDTFFETIKYAASSPKSIYVPHDVFASREVNASTGTFSHNITAPSGRLGETLNVPTGVLNTFTMDGANITSVITSSDSFADVNTAFMTAAAIEDRYSGGTSPGGSDTQVQFNNAGSFGGSANFTFDNDGGAGGSGVLTLPHINLTLGSGLFIADNVTVNDRLELGGAGSQFFAFNEDTVKVKFANWYSSNSHQYGMGMLYYETFFAATEDTDSGNDQKRRIGFYLEKPDNGASDTDGSATVQGQNARFAIARDNILVNHDNTFRLYEDNSGTFGTNYIDLVWPASLSANSMVYIPAVSGHIATFSVAPTGAIAADPNELNHLEGVTGITLATAGDVLVVGGDGSSIASTTTLPIANGGTNASNISDARSNLGVAIGSDVQAYDAGLTSIAGLTTAANKMIYTSASDTYAVTDLTAAARTVLDDSTVSDMRTTLGVAIGSDVQAYDAGLTSIAGLTTAANKMIYTTASDTYAVADLTAAARTVLDDSTVSDMRTTLGVAIGSDVQAHNDILDDLAGLTQAANKLPYFDAATTAATTDLTSFGRSLIDDADAATARGTLGLGSIATLSSIDISSNTNLAVTAPIVLTGDTLSLSASLNDLSNVSTDALAAGNLLAYNAASGAFVNSSLLAIDTVNDRVGIGTSSPEVKLHIDGDAAQEAQIRLEQHNNTADAPDIRIRRSRGTHASPSVLSANDYAFRLNVDIYDGASYTNAGQLRWDNDGTTNNNSTNTVFGLQTRVSGTTADRITVDSTGDVIIAGNLDISDGNITNVGDIDCDSISVADAANGLNVDLSGANTGTGKITLKDNVASALDITESSNSYIKFNTQNKTDEVTYSKEAVEISKPLKCTQAIHSSISKTNAISTGQTLKGGGTGNVVTLDLASAGFFRVQLTANVDEIWFKNQSEGQKVIIRFEQDATGSRTVDFSAFYAYDGTAVAVNFADGTAPTLTTTASKADIIGFLNFGIPAGSVHYYNAVVIGQNFS